ncbi:hypothetical protein [Streptosporangium carneum]|uniref:MucB/RseB N-terminal domain-containing protein n=1 Tax=Streptosporangium carneum TaxID=47481 RepID=A0A9W6I4L8_9ACTN|nr:hypothetical protein [Streptosporangium carneum]GLK11956.1 hypothetical protein GCM10017600_53640 [Streptosporangium carneum]
MRRWIALVTAALLAPALVTTAPSAAQAAPVDPVKALRQQLRPGHGVQITETDRGYSGRSVTTARHRGVLQFDRSGIVAVDITRRASTTPSVGRGVYMRRTIAVGGRNYHFEPSELDKLPEGRTWVRENWKGPWDALNSDQILNVIDPVTLGYMLRTSALRLPERGGVQYRGTITWAQLHKVSRSFRELWRLGPLGKLGRSKIKWRLWLDTRGLPVRVLTEDTLGGFLDNSVNDIRYTGWGSLVTVTPPPADQVIDTRDVDYDAKPRTPLSVVIEGARTGGPADAGARLSLGSDAGREKTVPDVEREGTVADAGREGTASDAGREGTVASTERGRAVPAEGGESGPTTTVPSEGQRVVERR